MNISSVASPENLPKFENSVKYFSPKFYQIQREVFGRFLTPIEVYLAESKERTARKKAERKTRLLFKNEYRGNLYQPSPYLGNPKTDKASFTRSVASYTKSAYRIVQRLIKNAEQVVYRWYVVLRIDEDLTPNEHRSKWEQIQKRLKHNGVVAFYSREVCKASNHIHYNLIVSSNQSEQELEAIIEQSTKGIIRQTKGINPYLDIQPVYGVKGLCNYVMKARVNGEDGFGKYTQDIYKGERVLFQADITLSKHGTIGKFWDNLPNIKQEVKQEQTATREAKGLADAYIVKERQNSMKQQIDNGEDNFLWELDTKEPTKKPACCLRMNIATQVATKVDHPNGKFIDTHLVSQDPIIRIPKTRSIANWLVPCLAKRMRPLRTRTGWQGKA